ncbi:DUF6329 domain-containing protein, partial [Dysosmobacter welbionis]
QSGTRSATSPWARGTRHRRGLCRPPPDSRFGPGRCPSPPGHRRCSPPLPGQSRHRRRRSWPSAPDTAGWRWRRVPHRTYPASHPPRPSGRATSPGPRSRKRRNPLDPRRKQTPLEGQGRAGPASPAPCPAAGALC